MSKYGSRDVELEEGISPTRYVRVLSPAEARATLVARTINHMAEVRQYFADIDHWNTSVRKPHEALIDPDPDGTLRAWLEKHEALVKANVQ